MFLRANMNEYVYTYIQYNISETNAWDIYFLYIYSVGTFVVLILFFFNNIILNVCKSYYTNIYKKKNVCYVS